MIETKDKCRYYDQETLCRKSSPSSTCMGIALQKLFLKFFKESEKQIMPYPSG